jgi:hypothetical protein
MHTALLLFSEKSPDTRLEKWNPMEEDFFSKRNSYNIDIDDAGVATTGYSKSVYIFPTPL